MDGGEQRGREKRGLKGSENVWWESGGCIPSADWRKTLAALCSKGGPVSQARDQGKAPMTPYAKRGTERKRWFQAQDRRKKFAAPYSKASYSKRGAEGKSLRPRISSAGPSPYLGQTLVISKRSDVTTKMEGENTLYLKGNTHHLQYTMGASKGEPVLPCLFESQKQTRKMICFFAKLAVQCPAIKYPGARHRQRLLLMT